MKQARKEIANLVTRVEQGLSDSASSAKDLGDLALQKYRDVHIREGLATVIDRARQEIAEKLAPRRKKAKSKSGAKSKPRGKKAGARLKTSGKAKPRGKKTTTRAKARKTARSGGRARG